MGQTEHLLSTSLGHHSMCSEIMIQSGTNGSLSVGTLTEHCVTGDIYYQNIEVFVFQTLDMVHKRS